MWLCPFIISSGLITLRAVIIKQPFYFFHIVNIYIDKHLVKQYIGLIINTNERYKMDTTDKLINTAKRLALQEMINKIKDEIEKLEEEADEKESIPF